MNIAPMRKSLIKELLISCAVLSVLGGVVFYLSMLHSDYQQEHDKQASVSQQLISEKQTLESRFTKAQSNMDVFFESERHAKDPGLFLDADALQNFARHYQSEFLFNKLSVTATTITDMKDAKYIRPSFVATTTNVKIAMEALTDGDIYELLSKMHQELPGFIKVTAIEVKKRQNISNDVINDVKRSGAFPLVESTLIFDWYGLKSTKTGSPFNVFTPKVYGENEYDV